MPPSKEWIRKTIKERLNHTLTPMQEIELDIWHSEKETEERLLKEAHEEEERRRRFQPDTELMYETDRMLADLRMKIEQFDHEQEERARKALTEPKVIPAHLRCEGTHVLGPSGSGKTSILEHGILTDYTAYGRGELARKPSYVIIDPKGLMVDRLSRLNMFHHLTNVIYLDPLEYPALNPFDPTGINPSSMTANFTYIFSTTKQKLTGKQLPCFRFCVQLLYKVPGATFDTLFDLLDDRTAKRSPDERFVAAIASMNGPNEVAARRFFETDYYSPNYASTREEVKSRLWSVTGLYQLFNAKTRRVNMAKWIQEGSLILVNTRMKELEEAHQIFGRFILSLAVNAIQSRKPPEDAWNPTYVLIDEFQEFADEERTPSMLRLMREYRAGAVLAHQNLYCAELTDDMRSAIITNTSIKYAACPEGKDLGVMASAMRCKPEFLLQQEPALPYVNFACYARGIGLAHPFIVSIPVGQTKKMPQLTASQYNAWRLKNRRALQDINDVPPTASAPVSTTPATLPTPSDAPEETPGTWGTKK